MIIRNPNLKAGSKPEFTEKYTCDRCGKVICEAFDGEILGKKFYLLEYETGSADLNCVEHLCSLECLDQTLHDHLDEAIEKRFTVSREVL